MTVVSPGELPVNPEQVWDYEVPDEGCQDEAFRRWYVARVLTRGRMADVRPNSLKPRASLGGSCIRLEALYGASPMYLSPGD